MINNLRAFQEVLKRNNLPTPDTYLGISELIRSLYRPDVSPIPERIREVLEELTWPVTVPAGNPVTFKSCSEVLASEALVTFAPKQSGTGDPSPSNIRPISGWNSLHLYQSGSNVIDGLVGLEFVKQEYYGNNVVIDTTNKTALLKMAVSQGYYPIIQMDTRSYPTYFPFKENTQYTFIFKAESTTALLNMGVSYTDGTNSGGFRVSDRDNEGYIVFTTPNDKSVRSLYLGNYSGQTTLYYETICVMEGVHTKAEWEAQNKTTNTATFLSTVYGGSYDFVSGKGTSEWGYIAEYDGETITEPWLSSIDVYAPGTTPSTGAEVVYKLTTPTEIELTPEEIELLRGINTVWTDGDNVTVKFQILK